MLWQAKRRRRRVRFEIDHIVPFRFGGETSLSNSQTLCSTCHKDKGINAINFRVLKSPLATPKATIELRLSSKAEKIYFIEELKRIINVFYYCQAVAIANCDVRPRSKYRYNWEIILFEGNDPAWLEAHKMQLIDFVRKQMNYSELSDIIIR